MTRPEGLLDGRYRLGTLLGRGGMGVVYRALDTRLDRDVAVKLLAGSKETGGERFRGEVRTLARFVHPNLVRVLDAGEADDQLFLVMDLVEGTTLAARLAVDRLGPRETASVGAGIAAALSYVHREGIVHRDVKPANILLDARGTAHLADFGIARLVDTTGLTSTGLTLGTPAYLAPEQVQGGPIGPPADVYALGLVMLECLTGRRAFSGTASEVAAVRLLRGPDIPNGLDPPWRDLIAAMTDLDPWARLDASGASSRLGALSARPGAPGFAAPGSLAPDDTVAIVPVLAAPLLGAPLLGAPLLGDVTARAPVTEEFAATSPAGDLEGTSGSTRTPDAKRWGTRRLVAVGLALVVVLGALGVGLDQLLGGPSAAARPSAHHASTTVPTTTAVHVSASTSTTDPSSTSTSTTSPGAGAPLAASNLVSSIESAIAAGTIDPQAGQQLTAALQPLLAGSPSPTIAQQVQVLDQAAQAYDADVTGGLVGATAIGALTSAFDALATTLNTTLTTPSTTTTTTPGAGGPGSSGTSGSSGGTGSSGGIGSSGNSGATVGGGNPGPGHGRGRGRGRGN